MIYDLYVVRDVYGGVSLGEVEAECLLSIGYSVLCVQAYCTLLFLFLLVLLFCLSICSFMCIATLFGE